jgi:predicted Zn-ribbon and HTH transcriptional regulator
MMYRKLIRYSSKIFNLFGIIASITDGRLKPQIDTIKIVAAIIIMHFSNLGSLNSLSQTISLKNLKAEIPSVSTIARTADSMNLEEIRSVGIEIYRQARKKKMLEPCYGMWVGVVDGHEQITSPYCRCPYCKSRTVTKKDGVKEIQYYHEFTAFILAGPKISFILDIEPVLPDHGEISSAYRLLSRVCVNYPKAFNIVIGDGLYLKETVFNLLEGHHKYTIAVLKEERRQLFEEANRLSLLSEPEIYRSGKTYYRVWDHSISGCWDGYGKDVRVIVSEEATPKRVHSKDGKDFENRVNRANWMWVTNLPCSESENLDDLKNTVGICHSRWQIENQCFNETVNIWNGDHVYRHSKNAIITFLLLLFICVNIFNIFRIRNIKDRRIKTKIYLIELVKAGFHTARNPLPSIPPIPI